jgi:hypothetical protein
MAFLYPKLFPEFFDCVEETTYDPYDIIDNGYRFYTVGMPIEKAMALIWKPKIFNVSGTSTYISECCGEAPGFAPAIATYSGQTTSTTPIKMSELACGFSANFTAYGNLAEYTCGGGGPYEITIEGDLAIGYLNKIYLYNSLYYIPLYYNFFAAGTYNEDFVIPKTFFAGNLVVDGTSFPMYMQYPFCYDASMVTNINLTTASEREAN